MRSGDGGKQRAQAGGLDAVVEGNLKGIGYGE